MLLGEGFGLFLNLPVHLLSARHFKNGIYLLQVILGNVTDGARTTLVIFRPETW